ncbi:ficolin-2-like, partial [Saccostrea cucullata]|uniref:ficolin-2-like n=1 Tax=Saccostrea cuccullata TaxID=36930 RepID=UPI002ED2D040
MDVDPKGWTVFQWRHPLTENFTRNWEEYKDGFGNVTGEFWLGNEVVHLLTKPHRTLFHIGISDTNGHSWYERFDNMKVASEAQKYTITLGRASGTAGDVSSRDHGGAGSMEGRPFTAYDRDNDLSPYNCADRCKGGWWFNFCDNVFLNGPRDFHADNVTHSILKPVTLFGGSSGMETPEFEDRLLQGRSTLCLATLEAILRFCEDVGMKKE